MSDAKISELRNMASEGHVRLVSAAVAKYLSESHLKPKLGLKRLGTIIPAAVSPPAGKPAKPTAAKSKSPPAVKTDDTAALLSKEIKKLQSSFAALKKENGNFIYTCIYDDNEVN